MALSQSATNFAIKYEQLTSDHERRVTPLLAERDVGEEGLVVELPLDVVELQPDDVVPALHHHHDAILLHPQGDFRLVDHVLKQKKSSDCLLELGYLIHFRRTVNRKFR